MGKQSELIIQMGQLLLDDFKEMESALKEKKLFEGKEVARICKLATNCALYANGSMFPGKRIPTPDERDIRHELGKVNEMIDAYLTGREPFQAIMPEEMARRFVEEKVDE